MTTINTILMHIHRYPLGFLIAFAFSELIMWCGKGMINKWAVTRGLFRKGATEEVLRVLNTTKDGMWLTLLVVWQLAAMCTFLIGSYIVVDYGFHVNYTNGLVALTLCLLYLLCDIGCRRNAQKEHEKLQEEYDACIKDGGNR